MKNKKFDVIIIGAGPAGMAAAINLYEKGLKNILLVERNESLGGILSQCIHTGFGLTYFKKDLTGPEYSYRLENKIEKLKLQYLLQSMVLKITEKKVIS